MLGCYAKTIFAHQSSLFVCMFQLDETYNFVFLFTSNEL